MRLGSGHVHNPANLRSRHVHPTRQHPGSLRHHCYCSYANGGPKTLGKLWINSRFVGLAASSWLSAPPWWMVQRWTLNPQMRSCRHGIGGGGDSIPRKRFIPGTSSNSCSVSLEQAPFPAACLEGTGQMNEFLSGKRFRASHERWEINKCCSSHLVLRKDLSKKQVLFPPLKSGVFPRSCRSGGVQGSGGEEGGPGNPCRLGGWHGRLHAPLLARCQSIKSKE